MGWGSNEYGSTGAGWATTRGRALLGDGWGGDSGWSSTSPADDFSPDQIAGLTLWLDPTKGITTVSGKVSGWADQSVSGNNASQATAANRPVFNASDATFGGQPSLSFDGAATFMSFLHTSPMIAPCTVIACFAPNQAASTQGDIIVDSNSTEVVLNGGATTNLTESYAGGSGVLVSELPIPVNTATVGAYTFSGALGATSQLYQNAPFAPIASGMAIGAAVGGTLNIGSAGGSGLFYKGKLAEVLVYNSALSTVQLRQVFAYLKAKYGVAAVILDFASNPSNIQGNVAAFRADKGIVLGTPPAVAQWTDQSGQGNNVVQGTAAQRPTLNASDANFGGQPSLSFAQASGQFLLRSTLTGGSIPNVSIMVVGGAINGAEPGNTFFDDPATLEAVSLLYSPGTYTGFIWLETGRTSLNIAVTSPQYVAILASMDTSTMHLDYNGTKSSTPTGSTNPLTGLTLGALQGGATDFLNGAIAELCVWSRTLSAEETTLLGGYVTQRYGASFKL